MNLHGQIAVDQQKRVEEQRLAWWAIYDEQGIAVLAKLHYLMTGKRDPWRLLSAIIERAAFWARERRYLN